MLIELEYEKESHQEAYNLAQTQQNKLLRISELEREISLLKEDNKNLRQATTNTVYLEGLVEDLRTKLRQLEERERECVSLRVEVGVAQGRLNEWEGLARSVMGSAPLHGPLALRRCIETLQQRELTLSQEKAQAESVSGKSGKSQGKKQDWKSGKVRESGLKSGNLTLKSLKEVHNEKLKQLQEANDQLANTKKNLELQSTKIRRLRKQITLITWTGSKEEVATDYTKARLPHPAAGEPLIVASSQLLCLVDSCQKEVTMTGVSLESQPNSRLEALEKLVSGYQQRMLQLESDPSLAIMDSQPNSRLEALEKLVSGYQQRMLQLESDPSLAIMDVEGYGNKASSERMDALLAEKAALVKEKESLQKEVEELKIQMEYRSLKGDFDMRDCKIMHFRMNPQAEAEQRQQTELAQCQAEAAKLRERVRLLEEGHTHDLTLAVADKMASSSTKEVEELKEKMKSFERQNQRLREVFKTTSHEFREAVYQLFGYKVDGLPNKIYRLSSLYAEAPDDHLLFKSSGRLRGAAYREVSVPALEQEFLLPTLECRRRMFDIIFLHKLINGAIDSPELLSRISLLVPAGTRSRNMFSTCHHSNSYSYHGPIARLHRRGNSIPSDGDMFYDSIAHLKKRLQQRESLSGGGRVVLSDVCGVGRASPCLCLSAVLIAYTSVESNRKILIEQTHVAIDSKLFIIVRELVFWCRIIHAVARVEDRASVQAPSSGGETGSVGRMSGGMELLETPFSATCSELIDLHLHQQHSIPVFLSALTMNLFQRQTLTSH
ncbi:Mitotic spindle assembly checkpoint protein MAD1 [Homalodisca vitripennis]|nr:Mitotic spindle assembly checkpoint protein MAD1 [Homalodisca vitripennis]